MAFPLDRTRKVSKSLEVQFDFGPRPSLVNNCSAAVRDCTNLDWMYFKQFPRATANIATDKCQVVVFIVDDLGVLRARIPQTPLQSSVSPKDTAHNLRNLTKRMRGASHRASAARNGIPGPKNTRSVTFRSVNWRSLIQIHPKPKIASAYHSFQYQYVFNSETIKSCNCDCRKFLKFQGGNIPCNCIFKEQEL